MRVTALSALSALSSLCFMAGCHDVAEPDPSATTRDFALPHDYYTFTGETPDSYAGDSVSSAGDVDGDGRDDLLVGAPFNDDGGTDVGKAYLVLAGSLGDTASLNLADADYEFMGENVEDYAGDTVSNAGDVDGDGKGDILIAAVGNDDGDGLAGKVYLVLGSSLEDTASLDLADADYTFVGEAYKDIAGESISSAGDVDGDGKDDILVGADGSNDGGTNAGKAYLFLGGSLGSTSSLSLAAADYTFTGELEHTYAGHSVSSAGDVDGDGKDDVLIAAPYNGGSDDWPGKVYLFLGRSLGSTSSLNVADADYTFTGENPNDNAGKSVSSAGDVDGDGKDDLLIGARWNDSAGIEAGKVYLVLGESLGSTSNLSLGDADYTFAGEGSEDDAGHFVAGAGDVDGDGKDDLLVGAPFNDDGGSGAGRAYLVLGKSLGSTSSLDLSDADYIFTGENRGDIAGYSVSGAGDVDGDGKADLLVGAAGNDEQGDTTGKTYLILGAGLDL